MIQKPFNQKKRITTIQIGAVVAATLLLFSKPAWNEAAVAHEFIEIAGLALVLICVLGRLWSILYVGGKKNAELVTVGPYSITRNPLYFFSTIGAVGLGMMFGSLIVAIVLGFAAYFILSITAKNESDYLASTFRSDYQVYSEVTPVFWPNFRLYKEPKELYFSPAALKRTFFDSLYFIAMFPAIEIVEYVRYMGYVPTILAIY